MNITFKTNLLNIPKQCFGSITQYLNPKECAQSLFRACTALRSTAFNWENLKVVLLNAPEGANKEKWFISDLPSLNGQDFGVHSCYQKIGIYVFSRNENLCQIPIDYKLYVAGTGQNRFYFGELDSPVIKAFQPTDEGLVERAPLNNSSKSFCTIAELPKNQSDKSNIIKFFIVGFETFIVSTYNDGWCEKVYKIPGCKAYKQVGKILYIRNDNGHQFLDLTDDLKPVSVSSSLVYRFRCENQGKNQFLFRGIDGRLIAVFLKELDGKKEMVEKWSSDCLIPFDFRIEDNENFVFIKVGLNSFVLDARTGCQIYRDIQANNVWLKRDAIIFATQNDALTVVEPLSKHKTVRTVQLPFSLEQYPCLNVAYRIFSQSPTKPAEHKLFVMIQNGLKEKLVLRLETDLKEQRAKN